MEDRGVLEYRFEASKVKKLIKVIGVGGGGGNAVSKMFDDSDEIQGVSYLLCNTDNQALENSNVPNKLVLGPNISFGLGAGNKPEKAKEAAEASREDIKNILIQDETKMVFITAGMGGGTGTGAAPVIGNISMSLDILTVGIVTIPFKFEGRAKILQALKGVQELRKNVDAILIVNNQRLIDVYGSCPLDEAFAKADETLSNAARGICDMIYNPGLINLDFTDVKTTLKNGGVAVINTGYGEGEDRLRKAIDDALNSPLLNNNNIYSAKKILMSIYGSKEDPPIADELEYVETFTTKLSPEFHNIWGYCRSGKIQGNKVAVTILASGFDIDATINSIEDIKSVKKDLISEREEAKRIESENRLIEGYYKDSYWTRHITRPLILSVTELDDDVIIQHLEDTIALNRDLAPVEEIRSKRHAISKSNSINEVRLTVDVKDINTAATTKDDDTKDSSDSGRVIRFD